MWLQRFYNPKYFICRFYPTILVLLHSVKLRQNEIKVISLQISDFIGSAPEALE